MVVSRIRILLPQSIIRISTKKKILILMVSVMPFSHISKKKIAAFPKLLLQYSKNQHFLPAFSIVGSRSINKFDLDPQLWEEVMILGSVINF